MFVTNLWKIVQIYLRKQVSRRVILFYAISDDESNSLKVTRCFIKWSSHLPSLASLSTSWRSSSSQKRKTNRCFTIYWKSSLFTTSELSFVAPSNLRCLTCGRLMWPTFIRTSCRISYPWCILQCSPAFILRFWLGNYVSWILGIKVLELVSTFSK